MPVVEDFVERYAARDWDRLADCFSATDFERVGPYVDVIRGRDDYLAFLRRVVPTLQANYELEPRQIAYVDDRVAFAELTERLEIDGTLTDIPEVIVFELDDEGRIRRMRLYLQQPGGTAPVGGQDAMGQTEG